MNRFLLLCAGLLFAGGAMAAIDGTGKLRRPNFLVIVADDLGYADVGFNGSREIPTPNLDKLAKSGVRFTNGYVTHSFCSPSRAGLLTGRYQARFGHESNPVFNPTDEKQGLPVSEKTLADLLQSAGYVTGAVGKWHLGAAPCFHPNRRGFDEWYGFIGGGHEYFPDAKGSGEYTVPVCQNSEPQPGKNYLTTDLGNAAADFVRRHRRDNWFLYLAFNAPHTPLQAPQKYLDRFASITNKQRRAYCAMVAAMDDAIGETLGALRTTGQEKDTLVFFLSDNGGPGLPHFKQPFTDNSPLRGYKGELFEGGIRVPFTLSWPAKLKAGSVYDQPVSSLDILPTALAGAGIQPPSEILLDGVNLTPYLTGKNKGAPHETLYWRNRGPKGDLAVRKGDWKYLSRASGNGPELYNLGADIGEQKNVIVENATIAAQLRALLDQWHAELRNPIWMHPTDKPEKSP